jgi:hypothetical protein
MTKHAVSGLRRFGRLTGLRPGPSQAGGSTRPAARAPRPALIGAGRFSLGVVAILKNEASYLEEWLCHHLAVGVEHFFLYDNGSEDDLHALIRPYVNHGLVTLTYFPLRGGQRDANNHAVRWYGGTAEWLAFVDIDEFLVPHGDARVPDLLSAHRDAQQVLVARREFCFSGHRERPPGLVTEEYRLASVNVPRVGGSNVLGKPIVRPTGVARMGIHAGTTADGATVDVTGRPVPEAKPLAAPVYAPLQVNHYYTKSWGEFEAKRARTSTSTHAFPLPPVPFDIPASPDEAADRWVPRTRAIMAEMRALPPSPYRYGSRLRMEGFPRNDQFSAQAAAVVSNELAGLSQPRKQRSFDLPRLPGLRGAVGSAAVPEASAYVPAAGRFLGSVHLRQQLAWLEASIAWAVGEAWPPELVVADGALARGDDGRWALAPGGVGGSVRLEGGVAGDPRCHVLVFALVIGAPTALALEAAPAEDVDRWAPCARVELPSAGTWLGLVALDEDPQVTRAVRVSLEGAADVLDLALATYG